jgi:hypothetical protein
MAHESSILVHDPSLADANLLRSLQQENEGHGEYMSLIFR